MSSVVENPPGEWFVLDDRGEFRPTNYVGDDGRVIFLVCEWGVKHVALKSRGVDWVAPSPDDCDYEYSHNGVTVLDDESSISTGRISLADGHAPSRGVSIVDARNFYQDASRSVARGRYLFDSRGVWFVGCVFSDVSSADISRLRNSRLSGDWRMHGGEWVFVGACAVNDPGLPVDRVCASTHLVGDEDYSASYTVGESRGVIASANMSGELVLPIGGGGADGVRSVPFSSVLVVEDVMSADGRMIASGGTDWRRLPLSLFAMDHNSSAGHIGSRVVGQISSIERFGNTIVGSGVISVDDEFSRRIVGKIDRGDIRGVSIDGVDVEYGFDDASGGVVFSRIVIGGATVVPIPAFSDAHIMLDSGDSDSFVNSIESFVRDLDIDLF